MTKPVQLITLAILLAVIAGLFMISSSGKNTGLSIQPLDDQSGERSAALGALTVLSPFFLGIAIVGVIGVLLWIASDNFRA